jgi:hypothetical protein
MAQKLLADWTTDDFHTVEHGVLLAQHRLAETGLFSDESLAHIIDTHPDESLTVGRMGSNSHKFDWRHGDRNGVSGEVLIQLVKDGRLWLNCRRMLDHHPAFADLVNSIYSELAANCPGFKAVQRTANLLISSPQAIVHYHVDLPVNMLWHVRGRKRVWVYPHFDHRFVSQTVIEKVATGEYSEDVPYDPDWDKYALVFDAEPGQLLTWPQHSPHRVSNLEGLNVSLSTEHKNPRAIRRINVHQENQFLRHKLGLGCTSSSVDGVTAHVKQAVARAVRACDKIRGDQPEQFEYPISFKIDPEAPLGYVDLDLSADEITGPHVANELAPAKE